jgi:hypothetical protein
MLFRSSILTLLQKESEYRKFFVAGLVNGIGDRFCRANGAVHVPSVIWRLVRSSVALQIIILFELWVPVINGIDNVLISVYAIEVFSLGDWGVGLFYAALGTGLVLSNGCSHYFQHWLLPGVVLCLWKGDCLCCLVW